MVGRGVMVGATVPVGVDVTDRVTVGVLLGVTVGVKARNVGALVPVIVAVAIGKLVRGNGSGWAIAMSSKAAEPRARGIPRFTGHFGWYIMISFLPGRYWQVCPRVFSS